MIDGLQNSGDEIVDMDEVTLHGLPVRVKHHYKMSLAV
jgi:hypothetical protein